MLYLGIDQRRNQLTVDLGNEQGELVKHRQVSTAPKQLEGVLSWLRELSESEGGFAAIVEVCGFNDWLMKMLGDYGCREIVLIQPQQRSRRKTDRRDARVCIGHAHMGRVDRAVRCRGAVLGDHRPALYRRAVHGWFGSRASGGPAGGKGAPHAACARSGAGDGVHHLSRNWHR